MFELEYCDNPEKIILHTTGIKYDYPYDVIFDEKLNDLDKFIFLVDMHTIIDSCANDLMSITIEDSDDFWRINKCLLNFVNAVYGYKEYVNSYEPSLKPITEKYYNSKKMYRFICDFRNYIIHQSIIIKDYKPLDEKIYINIDEVNKQLIDYEYPKEWQRRNAVDFSKWLESFKVDSLEIIEGRYLNMKNLATLVLDEMSCMKEEVLLYACKKSVAPAIKWMIGSIPYIGGKYKYAFVVDKKIHDSVREPNYALEDFLRRMRKSLGVNSSSVKEIITLLKEEKYTYIYNDKCDLDYYVESK